MARKKRTAASQGQPDGKDEGSHLDALGEPNEVTEEAPSKAKAKPSKPKAASWPDPAYTEVECPACSHVVFLGTADTGENLWLERQRRIIVFAGPYDDDGLPVDGMSLWEEVTGRLVLGRSATAEERDHFKAHKSLDGVVPWAIGHEGHLVHCVRLDLWMSGVARVRRASLNSNARGSFYDLTTLQAQAKLREEEATR